MNKPQATSHMSYALKAANCSAIRTLQAAFPNSTPCCFRKIDPATRTVRKIAKQLIIGLGNPGPKYQHHRHNAGYLFIDALKAAKLPNLILEKTGVFMNDSGQAVKSLYTKYDIRDTKYLFIAHDDLDLPLGSFKIQFATGPQIHAGLLSIEKSLGTDQFWHIRIGIDNRDPQNRTPGETYVLQDFTPQEQQIIKGVISKIIAELKSDQETRK